jgi:hypothetical protein
MYQDVRVEELGHWHHRGDIPGRPLIRGLADAPEIAGSDGVHVVDGAAVLGVGGRHRPAQHPVRPGQAVRVEARYVGVVDLRERGALASGRIADVEGAVGGDNEEAVAGGEQCEVLGGRGPVGANDGAPLAGTVVEGVDPALPGVPGGDELELGLAAVMGEEECHVGGEAAAPGTADGAATEEGLQRKARQYLREDELLGEPGLAAG